MFAADSKDLSTCLPDALRSGKGTSWKQLIEPVEPFLESVTSRLCEQVDVFDPEVRPYAEYALKGQGKHLRPALVALTAEALGNTEPAHVTISVIIEMVHLATLVHDDIMDEAEIRRGKLTVAANWGNDIAVLFGDCLFAQALVLAAGFPTPEVCRAVAQATNTVCTGEILQTRNRGDFSFSKDRYFKILEMKTAELFALSCSLSAYISSTGKPYRNALRQFGLAFGTAYQIYDDCLDVFGTETAAGKSLGTDLAKGKLTLPVLLAWERADSKDKTCLTRLVQSWGANGDHSKVMGELLLKYDALAASLEVFRQYLDTAQNAIQDLPVKKTGLAGLTEYLALQGTLLGAAPDGCL
jgi:octaprenyl-diphosphate synthase